MELCNFVDVSLLNRIEYMKDYFLFYTCVGTKIQDDFQVTFFN